MIISKQSSTHQSFATIHPYSNHLTHSNHLEAIIHTQQSCHGAAQFVSLEFSIVHVDELQNSQCQGSSSKGSSSKDEAGDMGEIYEKLNKTCIDIEKSIKSVTRLTDLAATKELSSKGEKELASTMSSMEVCSKEASDMGFLIKFKKAREGGEKLSKISAIKAQHKAAASFAEMMQNAAALKACLPKPKKEEDEE